MITTPLLPPTKYTQNKSLGQSQAGVTSAAATECSSEDKVYSPSFGLVLDDRDQRDLEILLGCPTCDISYR